MGRGAHGSHIKPWGHHCVWSATAALPGEGEGSSSGWRGAGSAEVRPRLEGRRRALEEGSTTPMATGSGRFVRVARRTAALPAAVQ